MRCWPRSKARSNSQRLMGFSFSNAARRRERSTSNSRGTAVMMAGRISAISCTSRSAPRE